MSCELPCAAARLLFLPSTVQVWHAVSGTAVASFPHVTPAALLPRSLPAAPCAPLGPLLSWALYLSPRYPRGVRQKVRAISPQLEWNQGHVLLCCVHWQPGMLVCFPENGGDGFVCFSSAGWLRRWLSTWLTSWRTAEIKCRRTFWPMEVSEGRGPGYHLPGE